MKSLIVALLAGLALTGSSEAQPFDRDGGSGWRRHEREEQYARRRREREEQYARRRRETEEGYRVRRREREEGYRLRLRESEEGYGWRPRKRVICHCWRDRQFDEAPRWRWRLVREDGGGWQHRWRHHWRRHVRHYGEGERDRERDEDRRGRRYEGDQGRWWHPERDEGHVWREAERYGGRGRHCREPMHAAGDADARQENARNAAIKAWQEQVINEHGERYINFAAAVVLDEHCDPARVGENNLLDLKRCVITAAPCLTPREGEGRREEERPREEERR